MIDGRIKLNLACSRTCSLRRCGNYVSLSYLDGLHLVDCCIVFYEKRSERPWVTMVRGLIGQFGVILIYFYVSFLGDAIVW